LNLQSNNINFKTLPQTTTTELGYSLKSANDVWKALDPRKTGFVTRDAFLVLKLYHPLEQGGPDSYYINDGPLKDEFQRKKRPHTVEEKREGLTNTGRK
jgi:hypothetical protein